MELIKKLIPKALLKVGRPWYHGLLALAAHYYYGRPSGKLVVVGVTGTAGKSTTVQALAHILKHAGSRAGFVTTVSFFDGERLYVNKHGLSMPGGPLLQRQLRQMLDNGCRYAIIEATSEGLAQNRHLGVQFDAALFTNLSKAHLDAHGSFQRYGEAKKKLFASLKKSLVKSFFSQKIIGVNLDDPNFPHFLSFSTDQTFGVTFHNHKYFKARHIYAATEAGLGGPAEFSLRGTVFQIPLPGKFNAYNMLMAAACAHMLGVSLVESARALRGFTEVAGRMEEIKNDRGVTIFVDYAPEPAAMENALGAVSKMPHKRIIHVFGSTGGHRDLNKRFLFGEISAKYADVIIITNDDVYDSDPAEIARNIQEGVGRVPERQKKAKEVLMVPDRKEAIQKALALAEPADLIIVTGKGSEQFLVLPGNKRVEWDDRLVIRELLGQKEVVKKSL